MKIKTIIFKLIFLLLISSPYITSHAELYDSSASVFRFQKQMAKRGNAESQFKLGLMYETGSGTEKSPVLATSWYKKAAQQHYKPASNRLTYLNIKKTGFKNSHYKWLKSLKKDARFNEGEALFLLGQMYSEGTGVHKSLTRSLSLLRKAAGGNIPGSETEIARVELELLALQDKYRIKEENKKTVPVVILPTKKVVNTKPVIKKTKVKFKKPVKSLTKKPSKQQPKKHKPQNKLSRKLTPTKKKKTVTTTIQQKPVVKLTPAKNIKTADPHPMDIICSGRNRLSRGCR